MKEGAEAAFSPTASEAPHPSPREIVEYRRQQKERVNLADLDGVTIVITGYELMKSQRIGAQLAIIRFFIPPEGAEREAYTFSRVVIRQLEEEIAPIINQGKVVKAKVVRTKRYLILAPPS